MAYCAPGLDDGEFRRQSIVFAGRLPRRRGVEGFAFTGVFQLEFARESANQLSRLRRPSALKTSEISRSLSLFKPARFLIEDQQELNRL